MTPLETTALQTTAKTAERLAGKLFGPSAEVFGQMLAAGPQMRFLKNQLKNFEKVKKIVEQKNLKLKDVNLKVLFPYLNAIALEEDETLQDMWANLFVNYIDASQNLTVTVYPKILSELSTQDVEILNHLVSHMQKMKPEIDDRLHLITKFLESSPNLIRIGLIKQRNVINSFNWKETLDNFEITNFGIDFLRACER